MGCVKNPYCFLQNSENLLQSGNFQTSAKYAKYWLENETNGFHMSGLFQIFVFQHKIKKSGFLVYNPLNHCALHCAAAPRHLRSLMTVIAHDPWSGYMQAEASQFHSEQLTQEGFLLTSFVPAALPTTSLHWHRMCFEDFSVHENIICIFRQSLQINPNENCS